MQFLQSSPPLSLSFLVKDLEWETEGSPEIMVDIGGSHGSISIELLHTFPNLRSIVQDLQDTIPTALVPEDLTDRLDFKIHNFFEEQPVKNADVYFLRSILHDWSDKYAIKILKNLVPALKKGAKVIVNEVCLPEPNVLSYYHEQLVRYTFALHIYYSKIIADNQSSGYDLSMKAKFNSKERSADDWKALFEAVDRRFKVQRIKCTPGSILSVIEAVWQPDSATGKASD